MMHAQVSEGREATDGMSLRIKLWLTGQWQNESLEERNDLKSGNALRTIQWLSAAKTETREEGVLRLQTAKKQAPKQASLILSKWWRKEEQESPTFCWNIYFQSLALGALPGEMCNPSA